MSAARTRLRRAWRFAVHDDRAGVDPGTPLLVGAIGVGLVAVLVALALLTPMWWYQARTAPHVAQLAEAGGLVAGDPVYVAGVPAGRVEEVVLADAHVDVRFRLDDDLPLGSTSSAAVRLRTVLGKRYLAVTPSGPVDGGGERVIPLSRTGGAFDFDAVGAAVTATADGVDTETMALLSATVEQVLPADSAELRRALTGIAGTAGLVADDAERIDRLLGVAGTLARVALDQEEAVAATVADIATVLEVLTVRRDTIAALADHLTAVLDRVAATMTDRETELGALTARLAQITAVLADQADTIDEVLQTMPAAVRGAVEASGNGPWVDVTAPAAIVPDTLLCAIGVMEDCS